MLITILRFLFLLCGGALVCLFAVLGVFFLAYVFSRRVDVG